MLAENKELTKNKFGFRIFDSLPTAADKNQVLIHLLSLGLLVYFLFMLIFLESACD